MTCLSFPDFLLELVATDESIRHTFTAWLGNWPGLSPKNANKPTVTFDLHLVETLPARPQTTPLYLAPPPTPLIVYQGATGGFDFVFPEGGLVHLTPVGDSVSLLGWLTPALLQSGRFEDLLWVSLASLLRQKGLFLVHGFAAASPRSPQTILLVGRSGSGKTTTGLALLQAGWFYLGNDVVLLQARPDGVYALPTPGDVITVRPKSLDLLPGLRPQTRQVPGQKGQVLVQEMASGWGETRPVTAVYFPLLEGARPRTSRQPLSRAIALSKLMEESVDRWDIVHLPTHLELLSQLTQQARLYDLLLGPNVGDLGELLESG